MHKRYDKLLSQIQYSLVQKSVGLHCECFNMAKSCVVFISALQIATSLIRCGMKKAS